MIRGVNLGNWLVLEKWMSPKLFDGTDAEDEFHLCADLDQAARRERLKVHRDSYITERDFTYLASHGIEAVRIPAASRFAASPIRITEKTASPTPK